MGRSNFGFKVERCIDIQIKFFNSILITVIIELLLSIFSYESELYIQNYIFVLSEIFFICFFLLQGPKHTFHCNIDSP